jgi:peptide/nickel transport system permease protein
MNELEFIKIDKIVIRENRKKNLLRILKTYSHHKFIVFGGLLILILIFISIFAKSIMTHDPYTIDSGHMLERASMEHIFGTDQFGRDIFSRVIMGSRVSLKVGAIVSVLSATMGSFFGLMAGYYGKWVDNIVMRITDAIFSIPGLITVVVIAGTRGPGISSSIMGITIMYFPIFVRLVRGRVLAIKKETYIEAEKAIGQSSMKIIFSHILPNLFNVIFVQVTAVFAEAILIEAALSFIGLGTQPPIPSWGTMLLEAKDYLLMSPTYAIFPGIAISITVTGINMFGDGLRDVLDPRLSRLAT